MPIIMIEHHFVCCILLTKNNCSKRISQVFILFAILKRFFLMSLKTLGYQDERSVAPNISAMLAHLLFSQTEVKVFLQKTRLKLV